jgi:hypothetical protein
MVGPGSSLFFQIAAGLIPILLFAGGMSESFRTRWFERLSAGTRGVVAAAAIVITVAVVLAEFFAIAEAVSADLVFPTWRAAFVADVLAVETLLVACAFLVPWLQGFPVIRRTFRRAGHPGFALLATGVVLAGLASSLWLLSDAALTAASRRDASVAYCVERRGLDHQREFIEAEALLDTASQRLDRARASVAKLRRRADELKRDEYKRELKARQSAVDNAKRRHKEAGRYLVDVLTFGTSGEVPEDIEEIITGTTGC